MSRVLALAASLGLLLGCEGPVDNPDDADGDSDADVDAVSDVESGADADGDGVAETDADEGGVGEADVEVLPEPWVAIRSPATATEVTNPVTFRFEAGGGVFAVTFTADGWPLHGEPLPADAGSFTYEFSGLGYERRVVLAGRNGAGVELARDEIVVTVVNPAPDRFFPIDLDATGLFLSNFDSSSSTASFGSGRDGGTRLHAGCDLYWTDDGGDAYANGYYEYNNDLPVYAVAAGTITAYYDFYLGTSAVEVDHGDFVVRYGEVDDGGLYGGLGVGATVTAGQRIATMGDLAIGTTWSMLHFELYSGELTGSLTDRDNASYLHVPDGNYERRGDLMNCAPFLLDILAAGGG